jgi:hypothetical protein
MEAALVNPSKRRWTSRSARKALVARFVAAIVSFRLFSTM